MPGEDWAPGKYVIFVEGSSHFYGIEVFEDGEASIYMSCRRHEGQPVDLRALHVDQRYRVVRAEEGEQPLTSAAIQSGNGRESLPVGAKCGEEVVSWSGTLDI